MTADVYIGNCPLNVDEKELGDMFIKFGPITHIDIKQSTYACFAFLHFEDYRDAEYLINTTQRFMLHDNHLHIGPARGREERSTRRPPRIVNDNNDKEHMNGNGKEHINGNNANGNGHAKSSKSRSPSASSSSNPRRKSSFYRNRGVFIGNIAHDFKKEELDDLLAKYGRTTKLAIKTKNDECFAFAEYEYPEDALKAIKNLNGFRFMKHRLCVQAQRGEDYKNYRSDYRILLSGLPLETTREDVKYHFEAICKHICFTFVFKDGTGYVEFYRKEEMEKTLSNYRNSTFKTKTGQTSQFQMERFVPLFKRPKHSHKSHIRSSKRHRSRTRSRSKSRSKSRHSSSDRSDKSTPKTKSSTASSIKISRSRSRSKSKTLIKSKYKPMRIFRSRSKSTRSARSRSRSRSKESRSSRPRYVSKSRSKPKSDISVSRYSTSKSKSKSRSASRPRNNRKSESSRSPSNPKSIISIDGSRSSKSKSRSRSSSKSMPKSRSRSRSGSWCPANIIMEPEE